MICLSPKVTRKIQPTPFTSTVLTLLMFVSHATRGVESNFWHVARTTWFGDLAKASHCQAVLHELRLRKESCPPETDVLHKQQRECF